MTNRKPLFIILFSLGYSGIYSQEQQVKKDSVYQLQEIVVSSQQILGSKFKARNRTGSAYYISPEEIRRLGYTDINRMLKAVPGVNMYEEDGFGLRPNISLRGTKAERSERISIMEDGVLAAPAPYSAPAAYNFPNVARMEAIEVLKGSSQVQYGPFTTGGAINLVSTPIPNSFSGKANISYGSKNTFKSHTSVGSSWKHFGYMVEYLRYQSDGFKKYEDHAAKGFKRNDIIAKIRVKTDHVKGVNHALELKFGYADENSDETYVGLSADDFKKTPFLRYAGSQMDKLKTDHRQWVATYLLTFSNKLKITTNAYYNYFHRNWYKLNDVRAGITSKEKRSIADVLVDPETNIRYFDILTGKTDREEEALLVRANNRTYRSRGIQTRAEYRFNLNEFFFDLEFGLRYHADEEDRFQWDDSYSMKNKKMVLFMEGIHGTNANRVTSANALAGYLLAKLRYDAWTVTAGLRYEDVDLLKKDYTKAAADLDTWIHAFTKSTNTVTVESVNALYGEYSEATGTGMKFYTPKAPTPKKALHPDFTVESGTQENLIHAILHVRRILTLHEGLRWFDIKRYGLEIYRRTVYNNEITVNDELKADDSRRAIQLPQSVITAGLEANPRN